MQINKIIADELQVRVAQVDAAVELLDEGNTVPFISRYRKEVTGSLNDEQLRTLSTRLTYLRNLEERKETILSSIEEQGKLTDELRKKIAASETLVKLEDLYRPYKPKRRTRASQARERGLQGLADIMLLQMTRKSMDEEARVYIDLEKDVPDASAALNGAMDIVAEQISDNADYREEIRHRVINKGGIVSEAKDDKASSVYETYYHFEGNLKKLTGYQLLALNRGEKEKILAVKMAMPEDEVLGYLHKQVVVRDNPVTTPYLENAIADSYKRLIAPSVENDVRSELTEKAEDGAISVFKKNLSQLLMQPPVAGQTVLGWDPAFRTGCKLAVVDPNGKVLDTAVVYPTAPTNDAKIRAAKDKVKAFIKKYGITLISIGNGTASRESEQIVAELLHEIPEKVHYVITNEAGASVYSASALATEEFPEFDVGQRSAASIARRVQDPLAELVKIDPKSIGVGQYQHDMNQKKLGEALDGVVEDCVNSVGVDLNTASAPLLQHISGINKTIAANIVKYREENGAFISRKELMKVPKLGAKAFQQCAGFLRINNGKEVLDRTGVHPESYGAVKALLDEMGLDKSQIENGGLAGFSQKIRSYPAMAEKLGIGEPTLRDIVKELEKPGRDPRKDMPPVVLRSDVLDMKDLKEGMILKGTVRNVIDFGAFVDIGVHQDGLVHISQMCDRYIKHPLEVVSIGDIVEVKVIKLDIEKKRIGLSMKL